jgi:hypothetical protein
MLRLPLPGHDGPGSINAPYQCGSLAKEHRSTLDSSCVPFMPCRSNLTLPLDDPLQVDFLRGYTRLYRR